MDWLRAVGDAGVVVMLAAVFLFKFLLVVLSSRGGVGFSFVCNAGIAMIEKGCYLYSLSFQRDVIFLGLFRRIL